MTMMMVVMTMHNSSSILYMWTWSPMSSYCDAKMKTIYHKHVLELYYHYHKSQVTAFSWEHHGLWPHAVLGIVFVCKISWLSLALCLWRGVCASLWWRGWCPSFTTLTSHISMIVNHHTTVGSYHPSPLILYREWISKFQRKFTKAEADAYQTHSNYARKMLSPSQCSASGQNNYTYDMIGIATRLFL